MGEGYDQENSKIAGSFESPQAAGETPGINRNTSLGVVGFS